MCARPSVASQWRHNKRHDVANRRRLDCLLNRLSRRRSKKMSKLCVTGLFEENPPVTGGFQSQKASNAKNVSIWWRHHIIAFDAGIIEWRCIFIYCVTYLLCNILTIGTNKICNVTMMTSSNGNIFRVTGHLCGEFTGHVEVFFDLRPIKWLSKQPWGWWFETLSRPLWRHRNCNAYC